MNGETCKRQESGHCLNNIYLLTSRYDRTSGLWRATRADQPDFLATCPATEKSLLLGPHDWTVHNDSCSGKTLTTRLTMTGCGEAELTCTDAACVGRTVRCDGRKDCADGSHEADCQAFVPSLGYNKFLIPPPINNDQKLKFNSLLRYLTSMKSKS